MKVLKIYFSSLILITLLILSRLQEIFRQKVVTFAKIKRNREIFVSNKTLVAQFNTDSYSFSRVNFSPVMNNFVKLLIKIVVWNYKFSSVEVIFSDFSFSLFLKSFLFVEKFFFFPGSLNLYRQVSSISGSIFQWKVYAKAVPSLPLFCYIER